MTEHRHHFTPPVSKVAVNGQLVYASRCDSGSGDVAKCESILVGTDRAGAVAVVDQYGRVEREGVIA